MSPTPVPDPSGTPLSGAPPDFRGLDIVVVGDLLADRYVYARPSRPSREAPLMVLREEGTEALPGGAANTARNVRSLGARVRLIGCLGDDSAGRTLRDTLVAEGVDLEGVKICADWATPVKTRVLAGERNRPLQQVLRLDREPDGPAALELRRALAARLVELADEVDGVIVSDYGYGMCDDVLAAALERFRARSAAPVVVDPRVGGRRFRSATAMTPNLEDLARMGGVQVDALSSPVTRARVAASVLGAGDLEWLLLTEGKAGMTLFGRGLPEEGLGLPAFGASAVIDVTGAGDTATALFTLGLAAGLSGPDAMLLANAAAGSVVMKLGAAVCTSDELAAACAAVAPEIRAGLAAQLSELIPEEPLG